MGPRFRADDGLPGSYASEQTLNDAGQKSSGGKFQQMGTDKRAAGHEINAEVTIFATAVGGRFYGEKQTQEGSKDDPEIA